MKLKARLGANSIEEKNEAEKLILSFFSSRNSEFREKRKFETELLPEDFDLNNYIFVCDKEGDFYSVLRYKRRKTIISKIEYDSIITTDFCIRDDKDRSVQKDLEATKLSLDLLSNTTYGLILGDARRDLGSYYKFFDFEQIGNYSECLIEDYNYRHMKSEISFVKLTKIHSKSSQELSKLKINAELKQFLSFVRSNSVWKYIFNQEIIGSTVSLHVLFLDERLIAYLILDSTNSIIEFGEDPNFKSEIELALSNFLVINNIRSIKLDLSNSLFDYLVKSDKKYSFRLLDVKGSIARPGIGKSKNRDYCSICSKQSMDGHFKVSNDSTFDILLHTTRISHLDWL